MKMDCKGRIIPASNILWSYLWTLQMRIQDVWIRLAQETVKMIYKLWILIISKCIQNLLSFVFDLWQTQEPLDNVYIQKSLWSEEQKSLSFKNSEKTPSSVPPETPIPQDDKAKDTGTRPCWARGWLRRAESGSSGGSGQALAGSPGRRVQGEARLVPGSLPGQRASERCQGELNGDHSKSQ